MPDDALHAAARALHERADDPAAWTRVARGQLEELRATDGATSA